MKYPKLHKVFVRTVFVWNSNTRYNNENTNSMKRTKWWMVLRLHRTLDWTIRCFSIAMLGALPLHTKSVTLCVYIYTNVWHIIQQTYLSRAEEKHTDRKRENFGGLTRRAICESTKQLTVSKGFRVKREKHKQKERYTQHTAFNIPLYTLCAVLVSTHGCFYCGVLAVCKQMCSVRQSAQHSRCAEHGFNDSMCKFAHGLDEQACFFNTHIAWHFFPFWLVVQHLCTNYNVQWTMANVRKNESDAFFYRCDLLIYIRKCDVQKNQCFYFVMRNNFHASLWDAFVRNRYGLYCEETLMEFSDCCLNDVVNILGDNKKRRKYQLFCSICQ